MMKVLAITLYDVAVSARTRWLFVEAVDGEGHAGVGEATLQGREAEVAAALDRRASAILAGDTPAPGVSLAEVAAASALDQASRDLDARRLGIALADALGGARRSRVPLCANIDRSTLDRSPEGFATSARAAGAAGHDAIAIAPFDEVTSALCRDGAGARAMQPGLARIAATRDALGDRLLIVDCHGRFTEATATALIDVAAAFDVRWLKGPIPERPEAIPALRRLRARANARGMGLAGGGERLGIAGILPFAQGGAYDVMTPDAGSVGALDEMLRVADVLRRHGIAFSPRNPGGPVCRAVSLGVCAVAGDVDRLEIPFEVSPLFEALVQQPLPRCVEGASALPGGTGHGAVLAEAVVRAHAHGTRRWARDGSRQHDA